MTSSHIPMALTLARLAAGPIVAALVLAAAANAYADPKLAANCYFAAALLFAAAALTDWLDGYLARKLDAVSALGAALDHAADKVLVTCALVALAYAALPLPLVAAAVIILGRDMAVAGLREGLSASGRALPVSFMGKAKAFAEMIAVTALLLLQWAAHGPASFTVFSALNWLGAGALWAAAGLALASGAIYAASALSRAPAAERETPKRDGP